MESNATSTDSKNTTREYWFEQIKQWQLSKLSQQIFCSQAGLNYNTFVYWRGQFRLECGQSKPQKFLPLKIKSSTDQTLEMTQLIKIKLLTGHLVYIPTTLGMQEIATLIRSLELPHA